MSIALRLLFLFAVLLCRSAGEPLAAENPPVRVGAAASLREALDDVGREYRRLRGPQAVITYAASSALARQIEAGAPFDVFLSADGEWMDYLAQRSLIAPNTRRNLLGNALVLIAPRNGPAAAINLRIGPQFALAAALGGGKLAMANPDAVPAGKYAKAALIRLGVWPAVETSVARAENVRAALIFVARGEAPLGIVYRTDALAEPGVRIIDAFSADLHPAIVYPAALLSTSTAAAATDFLAFLGEPPAQAIWRRHGFVVLQ
jgi:molybdate transport system substrate-binding protein